jgi:hypothetical protein
MFVKLLANSASVKAQAFTAERRGVEGAGYRTRNLSLRQDPMIA